jgi:hypothetical protein
MPATPSAPVRRSASAVSADQGGGLDGDAVAGKPMGNERWYVDNSGAVTKTAI